MRCFRFRSIRGQDVYFLFLCLFFLKRFLRLWVAILCLFLFFPLGIASKLYFTLVFTLLTKVFAGLKAGIECSGIMMVVFLEMLRAVFLALFFTMKLPNPLR